MSWFALVQRKHVQNPRTEPILTTVRSANALDGLELATTDALALALLFSRKKEQHSF